MFILNAIVHGTDKLRIQQNLSLFALFRYLLCLAITIPRGLSQYEAWRPLLRGAMRTADGPDGLHKSLSDILQNNLICCLNIITLKVCIWQRMLNLEIVFLWHNTANSLSVNSQEVITSNHHVVSSYLL